MKTNHKFNTFLKFALGICLVLVIACKKESNQLIAQSTSQVVANQSLEIYPHSEEFKNSTLHGAMFLQNRTSCTKCHGENFSGGTSRVACSSCHNYPHNLGWAQPQNHGSYFAKILADQKKTQKDPLKRNVKECMMCHEKPADSNATGTEVSQHSNKIPLCNACHADVPHGKKFLVNGEAIEHGDFVKSNPSIMGSCFSCHLNTNRAAPSPKASCLKCHEGPPFEEKAPDPEPTPEPTPAS